MEAGNLLQNIDFANEEHLERIKGIINDELQQLMSDKHNMSNMHEKMLVSAQKEVMPFINAILDFKSFCNFAALKNAVDYIAACQQENRAPSLSEIEGYKELCYNTAFIFDTNMEDECDECEREEFDRLRHMYYKEIAQKDAGTQIIAECFWNPVFSEYYRFLGYFSSEGGSKERDVHICRNLIIDIFFDVLWALDNECGHTMENSYFKKAVMNVFTLKDEN